MKTHTFTLLFGCLAAIVLMSGAVPFIESIDETEPKEPPKNESGENESNEVPQNGPENRNLVQEEAETTDYSEAIQFKVNLKDIDAEKGLDTGEFKSNGLVWKIHLAKRNDSTANEGANQQAGKNVLDISLVGIFAGDTKKWSIEVEAAFKLFLKNSNETLTKLFATKTIDTNTKCEIQGFVDWDEFKDKYANEGVAIFEIDLKMGKPNRHELERIWAKIQFPVRNVLRDAQSSEIVVRGIRWHALSQRKTYNNGDAIAIFLYANSDDMDFNLKWNVDMKFTLLSWKKGEKPLTKEVSHEFSWNDMNYGYVSFLNWNEFTDAEKQYVVGNSAVFEFEFHVSEPKKNE